MVENHNGHDHLRDPELLALAWELLAQEWTVLRKMCCIAVRKDPRRQDTWEEAMSEVADRLPQFLWTYDPAGGTTLRSHVIGAARWYLYKLFVTERPERREKKRIEDMIARFGWREYHENDQCDLYDQDEVQSILTGLHPFHKSVLQLYFMSGLTYEEIGGVLECSKSAARSRVLKALEVARERAGA